MAYYHFAQIIQKKAETLCDKVAFKYKDLLTGNWVSVTWNEFSENILKAAAALSALGVKEHEPIGYYSQNMPQHLIADYAAYANRAIVVPMYATSTVEQVQYIVNDTQLKFIFAGEQYQYDNAFEIQQTSQYLKKIIVYSRKVKFHKEDNTSIYFDDFLAQFGNANDRETVALRTRSAKEDDIATIMYTSGTTGEPKGVILKHSNYLEAMRIHDIRLNVSKDDISFSFLPLSHIFEKAWTYYAFYKEMIVVLNHDPKLVQQTIKEVRPTIMCSVPRFWEKVYIGVQKQIETSGFVKKWLFKSAIKTGKKYLIDYKNNGKKAPAGLALKFRLFNKLVFEKLHKAIGIENGRMFPTAGAPLSNTVCEFLLSVNIPILSGYGLTETTATVACVPPAESLEIGSVGFLMPGIEMKLGENNELLVKGKTVMHGYYNKPLETAAAFTDDGFFRTGDAVAIKNGVITITERLKDLYKTSNGKYIAPQAIESKMVEDKFIDQVAVIGDQRKFVSALIVPIYETLEEYAKQNGIKYDNREELLSKKVILQMMHKRIEALQKQLPSFEQIKQFTLLPAPFTIENGALTNTLKIRRAVILERYKHEIEAMYR